jgi:ankyrin repeat protein
MKAYKFGEEIFHDAKEGNEPKVFRILLQNRAAIFSRDTTFKTTLMWACIRGHHKIA